MARNQITVEQYIGFRKKQEFGEKRKVNILILLLDSVYVRTLNVAQILQKIRIFIVI